MKLVSFERRGVPGFGIVAREGVIDLSARLAGRAASLDRALADTDSLARLADQPADFALAEITLLPPIPDSRRIVCVGLNYRSHIAETGRDTPKYPMLFPRYPDSLVGHDAPMLRPTASSQFDFEGELAFVIGRPGRAIKPEQALAHVAGYACLNDGSLRDFQRHTTQFMPGKNFAGSGSFGPWLVTPDEFTDIGTRRIETRLNGETMQSALLDDLLFGVEDLIAYLSTMWELRPGDVVATGTTGGVGLYREPQVWMKPGDTVEVEIAGIGTLRNRIVQETTHAGAQP